MTDTPNPTTPLSERIPHDRHLHSSLCWSYYINDADKRETFLSCQLVAGQCELNCRSCSVAAIESQLADSQQKAQAMVGAAIQAAKQVVIDWFEEECPIADKIGELTLADARAALDRVIAEAVASVGLELADAKDALYVAGQQLAAAKADRERAVRGARLEEARLFHAMETEDEMRQRIAALEAEVTLR